MEGAVALDHVDALAEEADVDDDAQDGAERRGEHAEGSTAVGLGIPVVQVGGPDGQAVLQARDLDEQVGKIRGLVAPRKVGDAAPRALLQHAAEQEQSTQDEAGAVVEDEVGERRLQDGLALEVGQERDDDGQVAHVAAGDGLVEGDAEHG